MKEQKLYVCECCGTQYKEKSKALDCEKSHAKNPAIKDTRYHAHSAFPDRVEITFEGGKRIWYKRQKTEISNINIYQTRKKGIYERRSKSGGNYTVANKRGKRHYHGGD